MSATGRTHQQIGDSNQSPEINKGRDALAKVNVAASTKHPEKEPVMSNIISIPQHPVGFKIQYFCQCGLGCTPEYLAESGSEECEILASCYEGPSVHLRENSGFQLNSYWGPEEGITFQIPSHGYENEEDGAEYVQKPITSKELQHLPAMVDLVLKRVAEVTGVSSDS